MNASLHRFDLLISDSPIALSSVLAAFADRAITPTSVRTRQHMVSLQSVTIISKQLADADARAIEKYLRCNTAVQSVSLEHMMV